MRILAIMLALVPVVGDKPRPSIVPAAIMPSSPEDIWHITLPEAIRLGLDNSEVVTVLTTGAQTIPLDGLGPAMPKVAKPRTHDNPQPLEECNLSLRDAIRIGLDNSEVVRVIRLGAQSIPVIDMDMGPTTPDNVADRFAMTVLPGADVAIAPLNRDGSIWEFQAAAMAHVRSIERQYWSLWQMQVAVRARESAVEQGEELLARERAELEVSRGPATDFAVVEKQVEDFKLNLVTATSDLIAAERRLRDILGLPEADGRRIVAVTPPVEAKVEPDWDASVREMITSQPDIAQQKVFVRLAELQLLVARNQLLPLMSRDELYQLKSLGDQLDQVGPYLSGMIRRLAARPDPDGLDPARPAQADFTSRQVGLAFLMPISFGRGPLANTRQAQYQLLRKRATLQQITHETTHSLARFFLEVDTNHKQFKTARRLNVAARQRVEAQRTFYDEGRITLDRLLDAIGQQADAVAQEARYLASYNTSLAALEESKGTLLAYDRVEIADGPKPRKAYVQAKDREVTPAAFEEPAEAPIPVAPRPGARTFKLKAKLGPGGFDLDIEVREGADAGPDEPGR